MSEATRARGAREGPRAALTPDAAAPRPGPNAGPLVIGRGRLEGRRVQVGDLKIFYRAAAAPPPGAPPIVLVHGFVVSSRYLVPVGERLAPHYRVYAPDLPGFGKSGDPPEPLDLPGLARALRDFMDAVRVDRAPLLGNSFGCQIITEFAVRYPERVSHAILVGPTVDRRHGGALQQIARTAFGGTREAHSLTLVHFPDYAAAGLGQIWHTFQTMMGDHIEAKLPHVQAPTLVVRGTRDVIVSQEWAEQMARLLPRGRLVLIPGAAHAINYSQPLELARVAMGFLAEERAG